MSLRNTLIEKKRRREDRERRHQTAPIATQLLKICHRCRKQKVMPIADTYCLRCVRRAVASLYPAPKWERRYRS